MSCSAFAPIVDLSHALAPDAGELTLFSLFRCELLHAVLPVRCCLQRQRVCERQRNESNRWRGQGSDFPSCSRCEQGAQLRRSVPGAEGVAWRGEGHNGRVAARRLGRERALQEIARRRLEVVGLLEGPPSMDEPPQDPDASDP